MRVAALLFMCIAAQVNAAEPVDWVNTYIGTGGGSKIGPDYGGTMPLVTTPFGMTNWTPQTRQNRISVSSYAYEDDTISGFIGTHQPAVWMGDYGYVTLMPQLGNGQTTFEYRRMPFSHADEVTTPYYYSVKMGADPARRIVAELTATDHCAHMRFTFPGNEMGSVVLQATRAGTVGYVKVDSAAREITGYNPDRMDTYLSNVKLPNFKGYFVARFRQPFVQQGVYSGVLPVDGQTEIKGEEVGGFARFNTKVVEVQVGTSFISIEQARANLDAELPQWQFEATRDALKKKWNDKLGIASIEGATDDERRIFYSGLYHALLYPKLFSENGRYYSAFDDQIHKGESYTAYSIWDTFRAEHSLLTLFAPERIDGMITALLQNYKEGGWLPKWPNPSYTNIMIGTHADSLIAESIRKGFKGFDYNLAYEALHKDANTPPDGDTKRRWLDREPGVPYEARAGLTYALELGYIPADKVSESASSTLEGTYDDYAVAQVAKKLGKAQDYRDLMQRSRNYTHLFNKDRGFMLARNSDGSWANPADGWTEGDQWVYLFAPLHDIPGVMHLLGGPRKFNAILDEHFAGHHNHHDNEPSHHYGYLYDYGGQPWKTQAIVRQIAREAYSNTPTGVLGNEDCGQMSAWYIFTAMGFYPVNPVSAEYMIGSPLFTRTTLHLPNGREFEISAAGNAQDHPYIQSARLNGKVLETPRITYEQIEAGGKLELVMSDRPSQWGSHWNP
jgi:predicted alpha-1,2-mannosidase